MDSILWAVTERLIPYPEAMFKMEQQVSSIIEEGALEQVWLLEHPALYTAGTSAKNEDLLDKTRFPVYQTGRGGEHTYHGPGQRIAYVMLDLKQHHQEKPDLKRYVHQLEEWIILTLAEFGVTGERRDGRVGIWVEEPDGKESKIAAIGVRVRKWVTFHGIAINVNPDLSHYDGIVPCGISDYGVTSLEKLGIKCSMDDVDKILREKFGEVF